MSVNAKSLRYLFYKSCIIMLERLGIPRFLTPEEKLRLVEEEFPAIIEDFRQSLHNRGIPEKALNLGTVIVEGEWLSRDNGGMQRKLLTLLTMSPGAAIDHVSQLKPIL